MSEHVALLVGESNPYSRDASHALLPWPSQASGGRLARFLWLTDDEYTDRFDRCNLLIARPGRWSVVAARQSAADLMRERPVDTMILLGRRVTAAFESVTGLDMPMWTRAGRFYAAPHPSGLSRVWADKDAPARLRALLRELLPDAARGA